jgi:hypothetical protein
MDSGVYAKVTHDILINNQIAFKAGETVAIEAVSPNEQRPEYKYVVTSSTLGTKFELSDADLSELQPPAAAGTSPAAESQGNPPEKSAWDVGTTKHEMKNREKLEEEKGPLNAELAKDGVDPRLAATIAGEEFQVKQDLGDLGPNPGTHLSVREQLLGDQRAPHLSEVMPHTMMAEGTCPQCGKAVGDAATECPSCGWHLHPAAASPQLGVIVNDIAMDGQAAFHAGEIVKIESETPDAQHPEQKYLVTSEALGKKFRLTEDQIYHDVQAKQNPKDAEQRLSTMRDSGLLTPAEYQEAKNALLERLTEEGEAGS